MSTSAISHPANDSAAWIPIEGTAVGACECSQQFTDFLSSLLSGVQAPTLAPGDAKTTEIAKIVSQNRIPEVANHDEESVEPRDEDEGGKLGTPIAFVPQVLPEIARTGVRVSEVGWNEVEKQAALNDAGNTRKSGEMRAARFPEQRFESRVLAESITNSDSPSDIASEVKFDPADADATTEAKALESAARHEQGAGEAAQIRETKVRNAPPLPLVKEFIDQRLSAGPSSIAAPTAEALSVEQLLPADLAPRSRELKATAEFPGLSKDVTELQQLESSEQAKVSVQSTSEGVINNDRVFRFRQAKPAKVPEDISFRAFASQAGQVSETTSVELRTKSAEAVQIEARHRASEVQITPISKDIAHDLKIDLRTDLGKVHIRAAIGGDDRVDAIIQAEHKELGALLAEHAPLLERTLAGRQILLGTLSISDGTSSSGQGSTDQPQSQRRIASHLSIQSSGRVSSTEEQECPTLEEGRVSIRA